MHTLGGRNLRPPSSGPRVQDFGTTGRTAEGAPGQARRGEDAEDG